MSTSGHLQRRTEQSTEPSPSSPGCFLWKEMWPAVRKLTPAEGLALVCLTSWVHEESGLVQASDRQVCNQTGVSRDVMKRLRRKLGGLGIQVTLGDNLSHDSCSYDFRKVLNRSARRQPPPLPPHLARPAPTLDAKNAEGVGAKSTEPWGQKAPLWRQAALPEPGEPAPIAGFVPAWEPFASGNPGPESGATPQGELLACGPTVQVAYVDLEFEVDLPSDWDDELERKVELKRVQLRFPVEEPSPPPLPPYEQWLARR